MPAFYQGGMEGLCYPAPLMTLPEVLITQRAYKAWKRGHPWVFKGEILKAEKSEPGSIVRVRVEKGGDIGHAFCNPRSLITLRRVEPREDESDAAWLKRKLDEALAFRREMGFPASEGGAAYRIAHAEADGLPGLIMDRYASVIVLQTLSAGTDRLKGEAVAWASSLPGVTSVLERNDTSTRTMEGLEQKSGPLAGDPPLDLRVSLGGLTVTVDPLHGQKTGAYLDQSQNRADALELARGRVLDLFCYQGWFSLSLSDPGRKGSSVTSVTAVDQSAPALEILAKDAARNGVTNLSTARSHVFDYLESAAEKGEIFDTILLDPPAFAKSRRDVDAAKRGYREILKRASRVLAPGGRLFFCSCSFHLTPELFRQVLADGLAGAGSSFRVLREGGAGPDHPIRVGFPESQYLKAIWVEKSR